MIRTKLPADLKPSAIAPFPDKKDMWKDSPGYKRAKVKSSLAKHSPGGQDHPQERHGAWATGTSAATLASDLISEGGFTVDLRTGDRPKVGISVALTPHNMNFSVADYRTGAQIANQVRSYIQQNYAALTAPGGHFGGWFDKDTGTIHLDVAIVTPDLDTAIQVAGRGEKSVYDLATGITHPNPNYDGRYG